MQDTDVLVVGGGPVGLSLALELRALGVDAVLLDKRAAPGFLPKMERCNARTMEIYRRLGIARDVRWRGLDNDLPMDVFICYGHLQNEPLVHHPHPSVNALARSAARATDGSVPAEPYQLISQYTLEPLLFEKLAEAGGRIRQSTELLDLVQDDDGVDARVRVADHGIEHIRAAFVVGCDGGSSTVRRQIGIELSGDTLLEMKQALFRAPTLFEQIPAGKGRHYHFADDEHSFLIVQDDTRHFSLHARVAERDQMAPLFERLVGREIDYETLYVGEWTQRLMVADAYRSGRVFLAGDSAHLVIPTGGLGMNTGVGDAVDLAWKLGAVLDGWGGDELLDSYETERRAVGLRNVAASRRANVGRQTWRATWTEDVTAEGPEGEAARAHVAEVADREQRWSNSLLGIELGYRYSGSALVLPDGEDGPDPDSFAYTPTTVAGARLPNTWLADGRAVQDVLPRAFTILRCGTAVVRDVAALQRAFEDARVPVEVVDLEGAAQADVYGDRLYVLRPDLHVAWRGTELDVDPAYLVGVVTGGAPVDTVG